MRVRKYTGNEAEQYLRLCQDETLQEHDDKYHNPENAVHGRFDPETMHCGKRDRQAKADSDDQIANNEVTEYAPSDALYIMLKVMPQYKEILKNAISDIGGEYDKVYCYHMTLAYGKDMVGKKFLPVGTKGIRISANRLIWDDNCVALLVNKEDGERLNCQNKHPHITLATKGETKPVYSNELAEKYYNGDTSVQSISVEGLEIMGDIAVERKTTGGIIGNDVLRKMRIDDIIKIAEKIGKEVEDGKGVHQRIPKEALPGMQRGGRILSEATFVARIWESECPEVEKDSKGSGIIRYDKEAQRKQQEILCQYARHKGIWHEEYDKLLESKFGLGTNGAESLVYFDDKNKICHKLVTEWFYKEPIRGLDRISLHNWLFPDTALTLLGMGRLSNESGMPCGDKLVFHVAQPMVDIAYSGNDEIITEYMEGIGFTMASSGAWYGMDMAVYVDDLHEENAVLDRNNNLRIIDSVIALNTPKSGLGGTYKINQLVVLQGGK